MRWSAWPRRPPRPLGRPPIDAIAKPGKEARGVAGNPSSGSGRGARAPLPPLIHGRARLLILCSLARHPAGRTFTELKHDAGLTDGTLSVHLGKLRDGGLVEIRKEFVDNRPRTLAVLTGDGRARFVAYVAELRDLVPGLGDTGS
jgi:DNA-binding transcriptional ArsR family regulator